MRGEVVRAEIRLGLDDAPDALDAVDDMDEVFSEQILGDLHGVAVVEVTGKLAHGEL
jgi:hypothetical protein